MPTTAQVAQIANISVQSVRNYTRQYPKLFSPEARGEVGGVRLFSEHDVATLCAIADLRKAGVPSAEIVPRILNADVPPILDIEATPHESHTPPHEAFALQAIQSSLQQQINAIERHHASRIEAVERRLEARERMAVWWARLQGAIAATVLWIVVFYLLWLLTNSRPWW